MESRIYELEFPDGRVEEYSVNVIIENMLDQIKMNDWDTSMFGKVTSIGKNHEVINKGPGAYVVINGFRTPIITTKDGVFR